MQNSALLNDILVGQQLQKRSRFLEVSGALVTVLLQCVQEAEAVQLELEACCLWLLLQLLPVLFHPLQGWL